MDFMLVLVWLDHLKLAINFVFELLPQNMHFSLCSIKLKYLKYKEEVRIFVSFIKHRNIYIENTLHAHCILVYRMKFLLKISSLLLSVQMI